LGDGEEHALTVKATAIEHCPGRDVAQVPELVGDPIDPAHFRRPPPSPLVDPGSARPPSSQILDEVDQPIDLPMLVMAMAGVPSWYF